MSVAGESLEFHLACRFSERTTFATHWANEGEKRPDVKRRRAIYPSAWLRNESPALAPAVCAKLQWPTLMRAIIFGARLPSAQGALRFAPDRSIPALHGLKSFFYQFLAPATWTMRFVLHTVPKRMRNDTLSLWHRLAPHPCVVPDSVARCAEFYLFRKEQQSACSKQLNLPLFCIRAVWNKLFPARLLVLICTGFTFSLAKWTWIVCAEVRNVWICKLKAGGNILLYK